MAVSSSSKERLLLSVTEIVLVAESVFGSVRGLLVASDLNLLGATGSSGEADGAASNAVVTNGNNDGAADNGPGAGEIDISLSLETVLADLTDHAWGALGLLAVSVT